MRRGSDRRVEATEGAATRLELRNEAETEERISIGTIRCHDDFVRNGIKSIHHALDERASEKGLERLILPHSGRLTASLNGNRDHLGVL